MNSPRPDWKMPYVEVGMPVIWYHEGNRDSPHAAICTAVGQKAIDLNIFLPGVVNTQPKSGVAHASDPNVISRSNVIENGCWEHPLWIRKFLDIVGSRPTSKVPSPPKAE